MVRKYRPTQKRRGLVLLLLLLLKGLTLLHQAETSRCSKQWGGLAVFRNCVNEDCLCLLRTHQQRGERGGKEGGDKVCWDISNADRDG